MRMIYLFCLFIAFFIGLIIIYWGLTKEELTLSLVISDIFPGVYVLVLSFLLFKVRNKKKKDRILSWEKNRKKGALLINFFRGVLALGLHLGFINWTLTYDHKEDNVILISLVSFTIYIIASAFIGYFNWAGMERDCENQINEINQKD
jgi:hypothetical protein